MARNWSKVKATPKNIQIMGAKINRRDAALCAILSELDERDDLDDVLECIDWTQADSCAGEEWLKAWFDKHRQSDHADRASRKAAALAKLTPAERKLLELDD